MSAQACREHVERACEQKRSAWAGQTALQLGGAIEARRRWQASLGAEGHLPLAVGKHVTSTCARNECGCGVLRCAAWLLAFE